jgi:hypothetical protein
MRERVVVDVEGGVGWGGELEVRSGSFVDN